MKGNLILIKVIEQSRVKVKEKIKEAYFQFLNGEKSATFKNKHEGRVILDEALENEIIHVDEFKQLHGELYHSDLNDPVKSFDPYMVLLEIPKIFSAGDFMVGSVVDRARVAYLFVLVRKLLDCLITDEKETKYKLLSFYCNWSMHVGLDHNQIVLSNLESIIPNIFNNDDISNLLTQALNLDAIPDQINNLVTGFIVKIKPPFDQELWLKIKPIFLELISSAPLNGGEKSRIREISVRKLLGVCFDFKIILKDTSPRQFITVPIDYRPVNES